MLTIIIVLILLQQVRNHLAHSVIVPLLGSWCLLVLPCRYLVDQDGSQKSGSDFSMQQTPTFGTTEADLLLKSSSSLPVSLAQ